MIALSAMTVRPPCSLKSRGKVEALDSNTNLNYCFGHSKQTSGGWAVPGCRPWIG
jgi:hypothetical protein